MAVAKRTIFSHEMFVKLKDIFSLQNALFISFTANARFND